MKKKKTLIVLTEEEKKQISRHLAKKFRELLNKMKTADQIFLLESGIQERLYYRFKKGGNPTLHTILLFSKALGVEPKELFDFDLKKKIMQREDFKNNDDYSKYLFSSKGRKTRQ